MKKSTFNIEGMTCNHCVMSVRMQLARIEGIEVEEVQIGSAVVRHEDDTQAIAAIEQAVADAGFTVTGHA